nr:hypothetical protein BgiMline_022592 [Biomphalaria glabrata]
MIIFINNLDLNRRGPLRKRARNREQIKSLTCNHVTGFASSSGQFSAAALVPSWGASVSPGSVSGGDNPASTCMAGGCTSAGRRRALSDRRISSSTLIRTRSLEDARFDPSDADAATADVYSKKLTRERYFVVHCTHNSYWTLSHPELVLDTVSSRTRTGLYCTRLFSVLNHFVKGFSKAIEAPLTCGQYFRDESHFVLRYA